VPTQCTDQMARALFKLTEDALLRHQEIVPVFINFADENPAIPFYEIAAELFQNEEIKNLITGIVVIGSPVAQQTFEMYFENHVPDIDVDPLSSVTEAISFMYDMLDIIADQEVTIRLTRQLRDSESSINTNLKRKRTIAVGASAGVVLILGLLFGFQQNIEFYSGEDSAGVVLSLGEEYFTFDIGLGDIE
jgi:hypothetical protein